MKTDTPTTAGRREWTGLAVLALPTVLLALDLSVLHLAAPRLSADLRATSTELLWILDIYGFMIAGFLITMGTLGDRIGRRRLLLIGAVGFAAASVAAAWAQSPLMLIATRALLGIAGATLMPSTLALIGNMFRDARQRGIAIGVWMTAFLSGTALGPVAGGLLLERYWWGSAFLMGVPVMVLLLITGPLLLPEYRDPGAGRLDPASVALSLVAMIASVYGLKELAEQGLAGGAMAALVTGAAAGVLFVRRQRYLAAPLLDLRLFRSRAFTAALVLILLAVITSGGMMLFLMQYLQLVQGRSALGTGLLMLPATVSMVAGSLLAPAVARRLGPGAVVAAGLVVTAAGYLLAVFLQSPGGPLPAVAALALSWAGLSPALVLGTDLVLGAAPVEKAGSASSMSETASELGLGLGVALLGTLGTAVYRARMAGAELPADTPEEAVARARDSLPGALETARTLDDAAGAGLAATARAAFTSGLHVAAGASAAVAALLALVAVRVLRGVRPPREPSAADGPDVTAAAASGGN
ncbi:MFS transporter [Streptomyces aidingensis]|uniref:MFS transporter, DHA2 family, multidrug resistance protein n=1 Tax=Streptomyces aidingensis TaxID=910347 RepID=A0A1I1K3R5_9ACTN|nr:MFS transporter [Streptomyces aidingensis]SFC55141.1 MFS transporter, DHA2 family, multidrug resistance protein [Streptomyces aidingensis]